MAESVKRWLARLWVRRVAGAVVLAFGLWSTAGMAAQSGVGEVFGLSAPKHHCCPTR